MEKGEAGSEKEKEEKQEETPLEDGHLLAKRHMLALSPQGGSDQNTAGQKKTIIDHLIIRNSIYGGAGGT